MKNSKQQFRSIAIIALFAIIFSSCAKEVKDQTKTNLPVEAKTETHVEKIIDREYMKEGFIESSVFRVVIVAAKNECLNDEESIKRRAENRAISTLQRYIVSQGKTTGQNTRSGILNTMNRYGNFYQYNKGNACGDNNIYYYDIKRNGIQSHILNIAPAR